MASLCLLWPLRVQLAVEAVETDLDVVTGLMMEFLLTWEQDMWVKVEQVRVAN